MSLKMQIWIQHNSYHFRSYLRNWPRGHAFYRNGYSTNEVFYSSKYWSLKQINLRECCNFKREYDSLKFTQNYLIPYDAVNQLHSVIYKLLLYNDILSEA